jgi:hypothetical protein
MSKFGSKGKGRYLEIGVGKMGRLSDEMKEGDFSYSGNLRY